jgi:hypothetical protein
MTTLLDTQKRFTLALLEPLFGENRDLGGLSGGLREASAGFNETADCLIRSTDQLGSRDRLGLYQRQYWYRLIDSLGEDFPEVCRYLGRDLFYTVVERYLLAHPPGSWNLRLLGERLVGYLAGDSLLKPVQRAWAAALAAYEFAQLEVFEAADLPEPSDGDFAQARFGLNPAVRLLHLRRPAMEWIESTDKAQVSTSRRHEFVVVWRTRDRRILMRRESKSLAPLLIEIARGGTLDEIFSRTPRLPRPAILREAFARWRTDSWLVVRSPAL